MDKDGRLSREETEKETDILEVWFPGCHCDVGGGSAKNEVTNSLSRIPLRWMIRESFITDSGIVFDSDALVSAGINPAHLYPTVLPAKDVIDEAFRLHKLDPTLQRPSHLHERGQPFSVHPSATGLTLGWKAGNALTSPIASASDVGSNGTAGKEKKALKSLSIVPPSEAVQTILDARSRIVDQLNERWIWWILEWIPLLHRFQKKDLSWAHYLRYDHHS